MFDLSKRYYIYKINKYLNGTKGNDKKVNFLWFLFIPDTQFINIHRDIQILKVKTG